MVDGGESAAREPPEPSRKAEATGASVASRLGSCEKRNTTGKQDKMESRGFNQVFHFRSKGEKSDG